jgi:hypothetical protein
MNPELVKFQLPTTDQFSVAVDIILGRQLRMRTQWLFRTPVLAAI